MLLIAKKPLVIYALVLIVLSFWLSLYSGVSTQTETAQSSVIQTKKMERTLTIIKPEIVKADKVGELLKVIEEHGFKIVKLKVVHLTKEQAGEFYAEHKGKSFFPKLLNYITSGPVVAVVLEKEGAIAEYRELMGSTDVKQAQTGTLRNLFGTDGTQNAVHGADSKISAEREINFFFSELELTY